MRAEQVNVNFYVVGLSNILDRELRGRKPAEGPHREVVGAAVVDNKLLRKVVQRVKAVTGIKAFLVLSVAALYFAVVPRGVGANELCLLYTSRCV